MALGASNKLLYLGPG